MHLAMLLQMAADGMADRVALGSRDGGITFAELGLRAMFGGALATCMTACVAGVLSAVGE